MADTIVFRNSPLGCRAIVVTHGDGSQTCYPEGHDKFVELESQATAATLPNPPTWTKYPFEMMQLLTAGEIVAIDTSTDTAVIVFLAMFRAIVSPIPSNDAQFLAGLDTLVTAGILTSQRRTQILAGELPA